MKQGVSKVFADRSDFIPHRIVARAHRTGSGMIRRERPTDKSLVGVARKISGCETGLS